MKEFTDQLSTLARRIDEAMRIIDIEQKTAHMHALEVQMQDQDFWNNAQQAQQVSQTHGTLQQEVEKWMQINQDVQSLQEFIAELTEDDIHDVEDDIAQQLTQLTTRFEKMEFLVLLAEEHDRSNAILAIHAGAGGTEAQDWAEMLLRMITRYAQQHEWDVKIVDESRGHEAGIKSVTLHINGPYAYGYLKSEHGVHRLVRISPFDAEGMRHTSFALIEVLPELEAHHEVAIDPKDLRIDTFMSSGKGGQSVNTTYSAVRIVHEPTGITVSCQNERSQLQNKETAMKILKSRLHQLHQKQLADEKEALRGGWQSAEWGSQIRSYVLHPYQMVKDHRTNYETADTTAVLDGQLDQFVEHYLKWKAAQAE